MHLMLYTKTEQEQLLAIAKKSIEYGLNHHQPKTIDLIKLPENLRKVRAVFVTLNKAKQLRGCIGTISATLPLAEEVANKAFSAAFQDPRFPPVQVNELEQLSISISVLSPPEAMQFTSEADLLEQIQPQKDGLVLEEKHHRGVFLPSVWEQLPDKKDFLKQLKHKAGLPVDYWSDDIAVSRYYTEYIEE